MSIGERIKMARMSAGLSQRSLAKEVGLSAMAISKYETGDIVPRSGFLLKLSTVLNVHPEYFFRSISVDLSEPQYRCRKTLNKKDQRAIHGKTQEWLERYLEIELITGEEKSLNLPSKKLCRISIIEDVEDVSQNVREEWNLGTDPIENVMDVLEQHGIKVGVIEATNEFDALTFYYNNKTPVIAINKNFPGDRQRYNLAHELGHLLLQFEADVDEEKAAHRFAGAFLVPKEMAYLELGEHRKSLDFKELYLLKQKYGLSMSAWIYRAKDLHIISETAAKRHWMQMNKLGWSKNEPFDYPQEFPTHMRLLIFRAMSENKISQSRARELIGDEMLEMRAEA